MGRSVSFGMARSLAFGLAVMFGTTAAAAEVLGRADGDKAGTRFEITQLKRVAGGMVELKFVIVNASDNPLPFEFITPSMPSEYSRDYSTVAGVYLMDGATKYNVARDANAKCICSADQNAVDKHARRALFARFPAPPESVTRLAVFVPHFQPVDDVPLAPLLPPK